MGSLGFAGFTVGYLDFRFEVTGGVLADHYVGSDLSVSVTLEESTFTGSFGVNFTGNAKGAVGSVPALGASCTGEIGDRLWYDANGNGVQEVDEPALAGVSVSLLDGNGTTLETITTDANGGYGFATLCGGDYRVTVAPSTLPNGLDL